MTCGIGTFISCQTPITSNLILVPVPNGEGDGARPSPSI